MYVYRQHGALGATNHTTEERVDVVMRCYVRGVKVVTFHSDLYITIRYNLVYTKSCEKVG